MQLREHDKFSLALLKAIAKALAPTQRESQKKRQNTGVDSGHLNRGLLDEFNRRQKPRGRAGSFEANKPSEKLALTRDMKKGGMFDDLDLVGGAATNKKADSQGGDTMNLNMIGQDDLPKP